MQIIVLDEGMVKKRPPGVRKYFSKLPGAANNQNGLFFYSVTILPVLMDCSSASQISTALRPS
jgi:hypothetical protein